MSMSYSRYCIAVPEDLDKNLATPVTVLGIPMVLWYDRNQDKWTCFLDQCPHRLAPLSEVGCTVLAGTSNLET